MVTRADRTTTGKKQQDVYYSDFLNDLNRHPTTGLLSRVLNENSVKQSIKNLIMTNVGERPFSNVGGNVRASLFEPMDGFTADSLKTEITQTLFNHEPRISDLKVQVVPDEDRNLYNIKITFATRTIQSPTSMDIILKRIR